MSQYRIIDDVLSPEDFDILKQQTLGDFKTVDTGYDNLWLQHPNARINNLLTNLICRKMGERLVDFCSFIRRTTPTFDTKFRVHADRNPMGDGKRAHMAAVLYMDTDETTGTALFSHRTLGSMCKDKSVFTEDDGLWQPYFKCESVANRLFIYNSDLFHGRYPWTVEKDRHVLVKFMQRQ